MTVGRICVREVDFAEWNETAWKAAERMHRRSVGTLVVLNDANEPIGIVTDRDLVVRVLGPRRDADTTRIRDIMTPVPRTVTEATPIESALAIMRSGPFRRLPVVDEAGKLVGLVCLDDILQLLAEELTEIGKLLARETPKTVAL